MATFDNLTHDTVKLLSDPSKTKLGEKGRLIELSEVNEELEDIVRTFTDVALFEWLKGNNACGCSRGDIKELLYGNATVNIETVECKFNDLTFSYLIVSPPNKDYKDGDPIFQSMDRIELPPDWPKSFTFNSYFGKRTRKLHIVLSPKLPIPINPLEGRKVKLNPQNEALYRLFLNHPNGLVPRDILLNEELRNEFKELWIEMRPQTDDVGIEKFFSENWRNNHKAASRKIHKMITALNKSLESLKEEAGLSYAAFYQVRQLERKKRGVKYFLPLSFLYKKA